MRKIVLGFLFCIITISAYSQVEKYPVFKNCDSLELSDLPICFKNEVKNLVVNELKIPENIKKDNFSGSINVVFLVNSKGDFQVIYVNTPYKELKEEVERVFGTFPTISPASFNNHPIEMQFVFPISIPLEKNMQQEIVKKDNEVKPIEQLNEFVELTETTTSLLFPEHKSELNIPFTHELYNGFNYYMNQSDNSHTAVKPYVYNEVSKFVDLDAQKNDLIKPKSTWFGKKLLNEHMALVKGKDFWITLDPMVDLQVGKDNDGLNTYNNTRAINISGAIGKNLSFSTSFYESQGRFAKYYNDYANSIRPVGGNPAIIPGRGIAKEFGTNGYDYPVAEAYVSYSPSKYFNFQFGNGKNFIGDGYRSLVLSDAATPYPYFKISTIHYTYLLEINLCL